MKAIKILIVWAALFFIGMAAYAQKGVEVPYEIIGGKIRIKLYINDHPQYFVFDTGASRTAVSGKLRNELNLPSSDPVIITDAASVKQSFAACLIESIHFGDKTMLVNDIKPFVVENNDLIFDCFHTSGILGNDVISNFIIEINSRDMLIKIFRRDTPINISLRNMIKFEADNRNNMPILNIGCGNGKTMKVLFDTGCSIFLSVKNEDFEMFRGVPEILEIKSEGITYAATGVSVTTSVINSYRVNIHHIDIALGKFKDVAGTTSFAPMSLLGLLLLEHGKVTIDYPRSRFYFEPYNNSPASVSFPLWDVGLTSTNGNLHIASLWDNQRDKANLGDKVTKINGAEIKPIGYCELLIDGLEVLKNESNAILEIESQRGISTTITMQKK